MSDQSISQLTAKTQLTDTDLIPLEDVSTSTTKSVTAKNLLRKPYTAIVAPTGTGGADYYTTGTNDDVQIQAAINAVNAAGGGTVFLKAGTYVCGQMIIKDSVSIRGESRKKTIVKLKNSASPATLFISDNFSFDISDHDSWDGISYFNMSDLTLDGNQINQSTPGAITDWNQSNALLKLWSWHHELKNIEIINAKEVGLYTDHAASWDTSFNDYQFGESVYENIFIKNYGAVGWINRGPHDSRCSSVYISNSTAGGTNAQYGYIMQGGSNYSSGGFIAHNLHVWGTHSQNAVYIDTANILDGFVYAEGSTLAAIKIVNSLANKFHAFLGYCGVGVELFGASHFNNITAIVESNVSGPLFQLDTTASQNILAHAGGYGAPGGAVFDLSSGGTYSGTKNTFKAWIGYTGTLFNGTPSSTDSVEGLGNRVTVLTPGTTVSLNPTKGDVYTLVPAQNETINAASVLTGQVLKLIVTTSGTTSYTLTFGTSFKTTGTLATGTVSGKVFTITFISDGTNYCETARSSAM